MNGRGVTIQELRSFVLVARTLSFTQAAARLGVSQPGLSMAIRQLEAKLGGALFDRSTRSVQLSYVGAALLASAERLVESFEWTVAGMVEVGEGRQGRLTIACPEGVAAHLLAPVIKEFVADNPGLMVSVFDGDAASVENLMHSFIAGFGVTGFWNPHQISISSPWSPIRPA
jgi:LysR family carnitine catabolism transcriptional activator